MKGWGRPGPHLQHHAADVVDALGDGVGGPGNGHRPLRRVRQHLAGHLNGCPGHLPKIRDSRHVIIAIAEMTVFNVARYLALPTAPSHYRLLPRITDCSLALLTVPSRYRPLPHVTDSSLALPTAPSHYRRLPRVTDRSLALPTAPSRYRLLPRITDCSLPPGSP